MSQRASKPDKRLLGTWRSDRRRTLRYFKPKAWCTPSRLRKFKALFGKLVVEWAHGAYHTEFDGHKVTAPYEVVARDSVSVVVQVRDVLSGEDRLQHIHFDGDYYWVALSGGGICEFFRRVPTEAQSGAAPIASRASSNV